jgi:hypothetical protein
VTVNATGTEINYLGGVTSAIQTQLNAKAALAGATFTGAILATAVYSTDLSAYLDVYDAGGALLRSRWQHDTGDSIEYRRSTNDWLFRVGGVTAASLDTANGLWTNGGLSTDGPLIATGSTANLIGCQAETAYGTVGITLEPLTTTSDLKAYKDPFGRVYLSGTISTSVSSGSYTAFTLPAGWRPTQSCRFICAQSGTTNAFFSVAVNTNGTVSFAGPGAGTIDLANGCDVDPINFRAA